MDHIKGDFKLSYAFCIGSYLHWMFVGAANFSVFLIHSLCLIKKDKHSIKKYKAFT